ncbi:MAG: SWIM zinc finger domain-containing protein [Candidatus Omnitrophota bacterium]
MKPVFDLKKIKFAVDAPTFERAVALYESGKVTDVEEFNGNYHALVLGTKPYHVNVPGRDFRRGDCNCYLGERNVVCKHIVALALYAVAGGQPLNDEDKQLNTEVKCGGIQADISKEELARAKKSVSEAMRSIKPYHGPSSTWFRNQDSLAEGCNRLSEIVSAFPVNQQTADVLVKLLLRLDKKLCTGGVDDSNGIVGGFMSEVVEMLKEYAKIERGCVKAFRQLAGRRTCFDWEASLVRIVDEQIDQ